MPAIFRMAGAVINTYIRYLTMHVSELQTQHISKLLEQAEAIGIENANRLR